MTSPWIREFFNNKKNVFKTGFHKDLLNFWLCGALPWQLGFDFHRNKS